MTVAQKLYESGKITYMRTDSVNLSDDALDAANSEIIKLYGADYANRKSYSNKSKGAQEAHEAIRPSYMQERTIEGDSSLQKLYDLIWKRTISSQMSDAKIDRTIVKIGLSNSQEKLTAKGEVITFDGFMKVYLEGKDEENSNEKGILPVLNQDETLNLNEGSANEQFTRHPARYTEASLVKKMEELGIGRPSTYASIISVLSTRNYVELINKKFTPTDRGKLITAFLDKLFNRYVDYNFTANLEDSLDEITSGKIKWIDVLSQFWEKFNSNVNEVKELRTRTILDMLNESLADIIFDKDGEGKVLRKCQCGGELSLKVGRFGAFIGCSNYPECKFTRPLSRIKAAQEDFMSEPKEIGETDEGKKIMLKKGRFGPYLQVGNDEKEMKNFSIPKGISPNDVDIEKAKFLSGLPKILGKYPENNEDITLNNGRFGPYVKCANKSATLESPEDIFSIGINKAITLIAEAKPGRRSSNEIKNLGEHPEDKKPVKVMKGQFGPYIKYKTINATIPDDKDPNDITMEEALVYIDKRLEYDAQKKGKTLKKTKKTKKAKKKK